MMPEFTVVLLAAGNSSRMGSPKQLLEFRGRPLLRHAAMAALSSVCRRVIVVLGATADELRPALAGLPVTIVVNEQWQEGMGTSIHAGVQAADLEGVDGLILALADQPFITPQIFNRLVLGHIESGQPIVASRYADTVGVPVFFSRDFFPVLEALKPTQGCKGVILQYAERAIHFDCPEAEADVDTIEDYLALRPIGGAG